MEPLEDFKSWWILPRSMRLNPPVLPGEDEDGIGQAKGPICPGHFIPAKSKHWNKILNRSGPAPYPAEMPLISGEQWDMSWSSGRAGDSGFAVQMDVPVAPTVGMTANADAELAFKSSTTDYKNFDKLETYMLQPWDSYIADGLKNVDVAKHIEKHTSLLGGAWEVYMISGIVVARGANSHRETTQTRLLSAGGGVGALGIADGTARVKVEWEKHAATTIGKMSDFVWAIQIARVYKRFGRRAWEWETLWDRKGAGSTFTLPGRTEARARFEAERAGTSDDGLANAAIIGLESSRHVFVIPAENELPSEGEPED